MRRAARQSPLPARAMHRRVWRRHAVTRRAQIGSRRSEIDRTVGKASGCSSGGARRRVVGAMFIAATGRARSSSVVAALCPCSEKVGARLERATLSSSRFRTCGSAEPMWSSRATSGSRWTLTASGKTTELTSTLASAVLSAGGYAADGAESDSPNSSRPTASLACEAHPHRAPPSTRWSAAPADAEAITLVYFWYSAPNWHWAKVTREAAVRLRSATNSGRSQSVGASANAGHQAHPPRRDAGFSMSQTAPALSAASATIAANRARPLCFSRYAAHRAGTGATPSTSVSDRNRGVRAGENEAHGGATYTPSQMPLAMPASTTDCTVGLDRSWPSASSIISYESTLAPRRRRASRRS